MICSVNVFIQRSVETIRKIACYLKPTMKRRGFEVNSYYNSVEQKFRTGRISLILRKNFLWGWIIVMATGKDRGAANITNNNALPNIGQQKRSGEPERKIGHLVVEIRRTNGSESKVPT